MKTTDKCSKINGTPGEKCATCGRIIYQKARGARWLFTPLLTHVPPKVGQMEVRSWPRGRCEFWITARVPCGKRGRWLVQGLIRCGEHRDK